MLQTIDSLLSSSSPEPSRAGSATSQVADSPTRMHVDARFAVRTGANVLLVGETPVVAEALDALRPRLTPPIMSWQPDSEPRLPQADRVRTLLIEQVSSVSHDDQVRLYAWLGQTRGVQVVTTADKTIVPAVESGSFLASLYYRLNVIRVDLDFGNIRPITFGRFQV